MKTMKHARGLSLIELMIAVTISLILFAGVMLLMSSSKRAYNVQSDLARMQEGARFAIEFMSRDLRMSGYYGCIGIAPDNAPLAIMGNDNTGVNGSDELFVSYLDTTRGAFSITHCAMDTDGDGIPNSHPFDDIPDAGTTADNCEMDRTSADYPEASPLTAASDVFTGRGEITVNDRVVVSDCGGNALHRVNNVADNGDSSVDITITPVLGKTYNNGGQSYGSELRRLLAWRYFVAANDRGGFSLYREPFNFAQTTEDFMGAAANVNNAEEIMEGVESMQLRFGVSVDSNNDGFADQYSYKRADQVTAAEWANVSSVRMTVLVRSVKNRQNLDLDTETYKLDPDYTYDPNNDHRLRQVFTTTIMLRNNSLM